MDPLSIMILSSLIPAGINAIKSGVQKHQQNKLARQDNAKRPQYTIPAAVLQATNNAKYQASQTQLPGQGLIQQQINQQGAGALSNLKDASNNGAALGSNIAKIYRTGVDAENQLGIAGANNYNNNQAMLRAQLGQLGNYQQYGFDYNQNQPYQANVGAQSALREGSFRNLSAAGNDIGAVGSGYANYLMMQQLANGGTNEPFDFSMTGGVKGRTGLQSELPVSNMNTALSIGTTVDPSNQSIDNGTITNLMKYRNYKDQPYDFQYKY